MDDNAIIQLYWDRDEQSIYATSEKYRHYCMSIARNSLANKEDADECVNDTYLKAWNTMPTKWPEQLSTFLGKITRNLSFDRYKRNHAEKRGGSEIFLVLDELADCVSDRDNVEQMIDREELIMAINSFVSNLSSVKQHIFIRRYWYADSVSSIAKECGVSPANISKKLERMRKNLKTYLIERGFDL